MRSAYRAAPLVLLTSVVLAGCSPASGDTGSADPKGASRAGSSGTAAGGGSSAGSIPVGAGPRTRYTVQEQPAAGSCHYRYKKGEPLPDPKCTPGATSPAVTQANLSSTICREGGYTKGIRPPVSVTSKEKRLNAASYGYEGSLSDAEYDHLISLQLGGDPNDPRNLWVQPPDPGHKPGTGVNNLKDPVETKLHTAVCDGRVTLTATQRAIATDWTTALESLGLG
ncbi:hypothetical protein [Streptomyces sp. SID2888]|uniref:hypothetical protein n=1 Tax=Streptomyces sp. SID2888 TaxID=2690256 RepID=UPI00136B0DC4|nr:hypothetical protein [Streptomyces sp. SID2888]MYV44240.1 hypothetical protein [Streptomyces sp. SID2888]